VPKIKWVGNRPWGTEFPEFPLPEDASPIDRPENIFTACLPYGIVPLLLSCALIVLKRQITGVGAAAPVFMPAGIILGLLLLPAHELLHAACYPQTATVYTGISLDKFAAFSVCHEPLTKTRFIIMSLMPALLGLIPLAVFFAAPPNAVLSGICIPAGIIGVLSPMPDYMDVRLVCRQAPRGAVIQTSNRGFFWYAGGRAKQGGRRADGDPRAQKNGQP